MANPQELKKFEKIPFRLRILKGFCEDPHLYEVYKTNYGELFHEVWVAVEKDELTLEQGRDVATWT